MSVRLRWDAGRMVHPPRRLLHIDQLRCRCLGSRRHARPTLSCTTVSEKRLGRRSDGQSVAQSAAAVAAPRS
eukprot:890090-Prymnesium_polylepis.1